MKIIAYILTLTLLASCSKLFKSKSELLFPDDLSFNEKFTLTINKNKKKTIIKGVSGNRVLVTQPNMHSLDTKKVKSWLTTFKEVYLADVPDALSIAGKKYDLVSINNPKYSLHLYLYPVSDQQSFVRISRFDKIEKNEITQKGLISRSIHNSLFVNINNLRKENYVFNPIDLSGQFIHDGFIYQMSSKQVQTLVKILKNFKANSYAHTGRVDEQTKEKLGLGRIGYYELEGEVYYKLFTAKSTDGDLLLWIEGDLEVLQGPFSHWEKLQALQKEISTI